MKNLKALATIVLFLAGSNLIFAKTNVQVTDDNDSNQTALIKALKDDNYGIRYSAVELLRQQLHSTINEHEQVKNVLVSTFKNDKNVQIRIVAALTLMDHGDEGIYKIFKEQLKVEKEKTMRNVLKGIVNKMERENMFASN